MKGSISRIVKTHGSAWGKIHTDGDDRDVFFNLASMIDESEFDGLIEGQEVEFDAALSQVNGRQASRLVVTASKPA